MTDEAGPRPHEFVDVHRRNLCDVCDRYIGAVDRGVALHVVTDEAGLRTEADDAAIEAACRCVSFAGLSCGCPCHAAFADRRAEWRRERIRSDALREAEAAIPDSRLRAALETVIDAAAHHIGIMVLRHGREDWRAADPLWAEAADALPILRAALSPEGRQEPDRE